MELFVRKYGNAPQHLIILHGMYGSGDNWTSIARNLSDGFTVHLPDLRNHGRSPHSPDHTYELLAEDIYEFVTGQRIERFYLAGHSMGGKTAMFFARQHPEMLIKMAAIDISPRTYHQLNQLSEQTIFHLNLISYLIRCNVEKAHNYAEAASILSEGVPSQRMVQSLLKNLEKTGDGMMWRINIEALKDNIYAMGDGLDPDDFIDRKIAVPTLFLRGLKSNYLPVEDEKLIHFIFSNARIVNVPEASHWMHTEQPEAIVTELRHFFSED